MPASTKAATKAKLDTPAKLSLRQIRALDMMTTDFMTDTDIAKELKIARQTIWGWKKEPLFRDTLEQLRADGEENLRHARPGNDAHAMKCLRELMSSASDPVKFGAIKFYWENLSKKQPANFSEAEELIYRALRKSEEEGGE